MDRPASPRPIDRTIAELHGETVSLDATDKVLESGKATKSQTSEEIILERTREVGRLRAEVAYLHEMRRLGEYLAEELEYVIDRLQMAVIAFNKGQYHVELGKEELEE